VPFNLLTNIQNQRRARNTLSHFWHKSFSTWKNVPSRALSTSLFANVQLQHKYCNGKNYVRTEQYMVS